MFLKDSKKFSKEINLKDELSTKMTQIATVNVM